MAYRTNLQYSSIRSMSHGVVVQMVLAIFALNSALEGKENLVFPGKARVKNIKSDFGARGDGSTDDTQAFISAVTTATSTGIYLPNGTYRVTNSILCRSDPGGGPWIYGQSRDGVVIKLVDNTPGFDNPRSPKPVIAAHGIAPGGAISADLFFRQWHNFTVDAGNNPGAIGVRYYSNNSGVLNNVRIIGNGVYGLDMGWTNMNGPCLIYNVVIEGFDTGIYTAYGINSQTMVNITIRNCRSVGVAAAGQNLSIENIIVENVPLAMTTNGMICVINGNFKGTGAAQPAIRNNAHLFCRNITTSGYSRAIESSNGGVAGAQVVEFASENVAAAFTSDYRPLSLSLPIKQTPPLQWEEDTSKWVCVCDYGAIPGDKFEDSEGFQAAIDAAAASGKTTVYAPSGAYTILNNIRIYGSVRHVVGIGSCSAVLSYGATPVGFVLAPDAASVVRIDNFVRCAGLTITNNDASTLVVENSVDFKLVAAGSGDVFLNNNCAFLTISNRAVRVWARQWNTEGREIDSDNNGGFLWILGLKTENGWLKIRTANGGMTEVLGAHIYNLCNGSGTSRLFEITDAFASFACIRETVFCGTVYSQHVAESRSGTLRTWVDNTDRAWALYSGAPASFEPPSLTRLRYNRPDCDKLHGTVSVVQQLSKLAMAGEVYNLRGARIIKTKATPLSEGIFMIKNQRGFRSSLIVRW